MKVYIKNKFSLAGGSRVLDANGNPVYEVKGKVFSLTRKKSVCTLDGKVLYTVNNKLLHFIMHSSFIKNANGEKIAKVKDKMFSPDFEVTSDKYNISISGKWFSLTSQILVNGQVVGIIRRQITFIKDAFELEASPENMPLMIALVIAVDNIVDNRRSH